MQEKIATFEKVSLKEFTRAMKELFPVYQFKDGQLETMLNNIPMPRRSTHGSAGYDFFTPFEFVLRPGTSIVIPTGIRVKFEETINEDTTVNFSDWALIMMPKSGIGTKTSIRLSNTLGLIDCDYYYSSNEGHIMVKLEMPVDLPSDPNTTTKFGTTLGISRKVYKFEEHCKFVQGMFIKYGITTDDDTYEKENRDGGFGSTGSNIKDNTSTDSDTSTDQTTEENINFMTLYTY